MRVLLDVTRTLFHRHNATPTGIDRVEHAFIGRLLKRHRDFDAHFVAMTPYGTGTLPSSTMARLLSGIEANWSAERGGESEVFAKVRRLMEEPVNPRAEQIARIAGSAKTMPVGGSYLDVFGRSLAGRRRFGALVRDAARTPSLYLHASHIQLEKQRLFAWTKSPGIRAAFLLHDLIPVDYPEFCGVGSGARQHLRMNTVASLGDAVVVNSRYTKARFEAYLAEFDHPPLPIVVSHLGMQPAEWLNGRYAPPEPGVPYFVHVGTIEGRKNVLFLLNVWRQLVARRGRQATPRLVLAGRRGWRSQSVFDTLDHSRELAGNVVEISDLRDRELCALVEGASAVVSPSLAEGFGLPPAEALSKGIPVIASDIPAHREIFGEHAILLDPTDGIGWQREIVSLAFDAERQAEARTRAALFPAVSWNDHVDRALEGLSAAVWPSAHRALGQVSGRSA